MHSNYVWLKLKDYYSFNNLISNTNHPNICAIYIPPETSPYFSGDIFDNIRDDINTYSNYNNPLMICGDLNARTSNLQDFISDIDKHNIYDSVTVQTDTPRRSYDSEINRHGQQIIQLCKENNKRIVTGRCLGDSFGKCTFFSPKGYKSLVDYTLVSDSFFCNISSLIIEPLTYLSDHCQVTTNIKMMHYTNKNSTGNSNYQWNYLPKSFKWKSTSSAKDFRSALNTPHIKAKIDYFMSNRFPETKDGIENANRLLTNILCEAAKLSLPASRKKV